MFSPALTGPRARRTASAVLAAVAAVLSVLGSTADADAQAGAVDAVTSDRVLTYQTAIFSTSNGARRGYGEATFRHQACVQRYAGWQAARMARQQRMFHQDLRPVLRDCHLRKAGENVAYGFTSGRAVVLDGWMKSPEHRRNLLDPDFRLLGSGARLGADGLWYAVQVFGRHS